MDNLDGFNEFLLTIRRHLHNTDWLKHNEADIFNHLIDYGMEPHRLDQVMALLRQILPFYLYQPTMMQWGELLEQYLQIAMEGGATDKLRYAHHFLGQFRANNGIVDAAEKSFRIAAFGAEAADDHRELVKTYTALLRTNIYSGSNNGIDKQQAYRELQRHLLETDSNIVRARINYALGVYHLRNRENNEALPYLYESESLSWDNVKRLRNHSYDIFATEKHLIRSILTLGILQNRNGDYENAKLYLEGAAVLCQPDQNLYEYAFLYYEMAVLYRRQGQLQKAEELATKAEKAFMQLQHAAYASVALYTIGHIQKDMGRYDEAYNCVSRAIKMFQEQNNFPLIAQAQHLIGCIYRDKGNIQKAKFHFTKARDVAVQISAPGMQNTKQVILQRLQEDEDELE